MAGMTQAAVRITLAMAALLLFAGACGHGPGTRSATTTSSPPVSESPPPPTSDTAHPAATLQIPAPTSSVSSSSGSCRSRGAGSYVLPDPSCTPGATNVAVTQANIHQTICTSGWTSTVRPPESYTEPLKYRQMAAYGDTGSAGGFEEDHLIPLELGGAPSDPRNLWPEPGASPNPKDSIEDAANHAVCAGQMTLAAAQQAIALDWVAFGRQLGLEQQTPATQAPAGGSPTCTVSASYNSRYGDWDVYVRSNQPDRVAQVTASGGAAASYHTNSSGYADVYLHAPPSAAGQRVTVSVGGATCSSTL